MQYFLELALQPKSLALHKPTYQQRLPATVLVLVTCLSVFSRQSDAATFYPEDTAQLTEAFERAGANGQSDIIDLKENTFSLVSELVLEPDAGFGLELKNGTLERVDATECHRLLRVESLLDPYDIKAEPVRIENVQFRNGCHSEVDAVDNMDGGGALATHRHTLISGSSFVNNRLIGNGSGGAILHSQSLEVSRSFFANNLAFTNGASDVTKGGAIAVRPGAALFIAHTYFLGNAADEGGALYASPNSAVVNITRSTFDGNTASRTGGAIWSSSSRAELRISNASFVANRAPIGGGALYTQSLNPVTLTHLTVWGNESRDGQGGGIRAVGPTGEGHLSLRNSIVANNVGGNCRASSGGKLFFNSAGFNLVGDESCGGDDNVELSVLGSVFAGRLDLYGGLIPSLPIMAASPALNLVPRAFCSGFDARDVPRLDNGTYSDEYCDAGAFEYVPITQLDRDGDLIRNDRDNCIQKSNPLQSDIDADGLGDACDPRDDRDSDNDGVLNFQDNCPTVENLLQLDMDENEIGDACDFKDRTQAGPVVVLKR